jgi:hypothetical protein
LRWATNVSFTSGPRWCKKTSYFPSDWISYVSLVFISPSCSIFTSVQCCVMSQSCVAIETQSNPVTKNKREPKRETKSSPLWNESLSPQGSQTTVHMNSHQLCSLCLCLCLSCCGLGKCCVCCYAFESCTPSAFALAKFREILTWKLWFRPTLRIFHGEKCSTQMRQVSTK